MVSRMISNSENDPVPLDHYRRHRKSTPRPSRTPCAVRYPRKLPEPNQLFVGHIAQSFTEFLYVDRTGFEADHCELRIGDAAEEGEEIMPLISSVA